MGNTRRDFLAYLVYGLGAALSPELLLSRPSLALASAESDKSVKVYMTGGDKRLAMLDPLQWHNPRVDLTDTITIEPGKKFQSILGFGGAFTDASCFTFNRMPAEKRHKLLVQMFGKESNSLGLNVCRTCIGASDYSTKVYSFDEGEDDPELKRFSIAHDEEYILPVLREARKISPDLFLFSTPWSPPGWMKSNKSMLGGNMQRRYMSAYAEYFVKFLRSYEKAGVPIQAVTVQNEVDTDQDGRMPACSWPQEYEADFVRGNLGPAFERANIKTKIWLIDHNYNLWGRAVDELETDGVLKYASGIAWHGYVGEASKVTQVHNAFPDVDQYWTEGGPDYTDPHYADNWCTWGKSFTGILRNWCRSLTTWNLTLDEEGKPNIGPFPCGGLVTVNSKTHEVSSSGHINNARKACQAIVNAAPNSKASARARILLSCALPAHDVDPKVENLYRQGMELVTYRKLDEGERALKEALSLDSGFFLPAGSLSYIYQEQKRYDDAIALLTKTLEKNPSYARGYWWLSRIYSAKGEKNLAEQNLAKARSLDPDDPYFSQ